MKVYRLRRKSDGLFYHGKGIFYKGEGKIYTSKGHIKNSLKQTAYKSAVAPGTTEIVTYLVEEEKVEDL